MTVTSETARNDYVGDGTLDTYDYDFRIFADSELLVITADADGVETELALTTDYSVTGVGERAGGTIVLAAGDLEDGVALVIKRRRPLTQETNLRDLGKLSLEDLEDELDRGRMIDQQLAEQVGRSFKMPEHELGSDLATTFPSAAERANAFLAFDAAGNPVASGGVDTAVAAGLVQIIDTVAALKAIANPSGSLTYLVRGYYSVNDGGGGWFRYNSADASTDNGGTILAPTTGTGRWNRIIDRPVWNARWFGAKGDGVTDDTLPIQKGLNALSAVAVTPGGGDLLLDPGKYLVTSPISLPTQCGLIGSGAGANSANLPENAGAASVLVTASAIAAVISCVSTGPRAITNVRIRNLYIDAGGTATYGIKWFSVSHSEIAGCTIRGATAAALIISTVATGVLTADNPSSQMNNIRDVSISEITSPACDSAHGILLTSNADEAGNASFNIFSNIVVNHRNGHGVYLQNCDDNYFYAFRSTGRAGCTGYGMYFGEDLTGGGLHARNNRVFGCQCQPNGGTGGVKFCGSGGASNNSSLNEIYGYSIANGSPVPTMDNNGTAIVQTDAGIWYYTHLQIVGAITVDDQNISSKNWVDCDTTAGAVTMRGVSNGIKGQVLSFWNTGTNNLIFRNNNAFGTQKFMMQSGADVTITGKRVISFYCDGTDWYER